MAKTPEGKLKDYLQKELNKFAEAQRVQIYIDIPPAAIYGRAGRPDFFIDLDAYHCRVEVKTIKGEYGATKDGELSGLQAHYLERHRKYHDKNCCVVYGKAGIAKLLAHLPMLMSFEDDTMLFEYK